MAGYLSHTSELDPDAFEADHAWIASDGQTCASVRLGAPHAHMVLYSSAEAQALIDVATKAKAQLVELEQQQAAAAGDQS